MKRLLNFGVPDPLTLGMAHPVADRLETLGRARPLTKGGRATVLGLMGGLAVFSAPFTVATDEAAVEKKVQYKFVSTHDSKAHQSYEVINENGEKRAFLILENGEREPAQLDEQADGTYRLTYSDGRTLDLPNVDKMTLEGIEGLKSLDSLSGLKQIQILGEVNGLESLKELETLEDLDRLMHLKGLQTFDIDAADISAFAIALENTGGELAEDLIDKLPEDLREMSKSFQGTKQIKIVRRSGDQDLDGEALILPDSIVDMNVQVFHASDPIKAVQHQLDAVERQLEALSENKSLSFDLENALRDIENAKKSIEQAKAALLE